jgi:hypothetical protein
VRIAAGDVELERVHQLMAEHVVGVGQRSGHRQHNAALDRFGEAARALADDLVNRVRLPELRR